MTASKQPAQARVVISLIDSDEEDESRPVKKECVKRRSRRISAHQQKPDDEVMLTWSMGGADAGFKASDKFNITWGDFRRLSLPDGRRGAEQLLLNDTIVDWYLKYVELHVLGGGSPERERQRMRTHIFSSFFLKRLRGALEQKDPSKREMQLASLLKWVQHVDLFEKDLLIVPVHEARLGGHWSLAVICFSGLVVQNGLEQAKHTTNGTAEGCPQLPARAHVEQETSRDDALMADQTTEAETASSIQAAEAGGSEAIPLVVASKEEGADSSKAPTAKVASKAEATADTTARFAADDAPNLVRHTGESAPVHDASCGAPHDTEGAASSDTLTEVAKAARQSTLVGCRTSRGSVESATDLEKRPARPMPAQDEAGGALPVEDDEAGRSYTAQGSSQEEEAASSAGSCASHRAPCILFFDSFLQQSNSKALFGHLRAFLDVYWEDYRKRRGIPLTPPVAGVPPPRKTLPRLPPRRVATSAAAGARATEPQADDAGATTRPQRATAAKRRASAIGDGFDKEQLKKAIALSLGEGKRTEQDERRDGWSLRPAARRVSAAPAYSTVESAKTVGEHRPRRQVPLASPIGDGFDEEQLKKAIALSLREGERTEQDERRDRPSVRATSPRVSAAASFGTVEPVKRVGERRSRRQAALTAPDYRDSTGCEAEEEELNHEQAVRSARRRSPRDEAMRAVKGDVEIRHGREELSRDLDHPSHVADESCEEAERSSLTKLGLTRVSDAAGASAGALSLRVEHDDGAHLTRHSGLSLIGDDVDVASDATEDEATVVRMEVPVGMEAEVLRALVMSAQSSAVQARRFEETQSTKVELADGHSGEMARDEGTPGTRQISLGLVMPHDDATDTMCDPPAQKAPNEPGDVIEHTETSAPCDLLPNHMAGFEDGSPTSADADMDQRHPLAESCNSAYGHVAPSEDLDAKSEAVATERSSGRQLEEERTKQRTRRRSSPKNDSPAPQLPVAHRWFTPKSLPHVFCLSAPQQKNEYDCGVYMLEFVERLATMECLPSFETTGGLVDAFPRDMLTAEDISQKRITMREVLEGYADTAAAP
mmetsp:Transcript_12229/g.35161  ORF Transcript_12229/g.35161 Transcript_12229/m.35161 type:complete len:1059 (-) Transcript_12229:389-3565(-)